METFVTKYAVLIKRTTLRLHHIPGVCSTDPFERNESISADAGNLIKVFNSANSKFSTVQLLDFKDKDPVWENLYECPHSHLRKVNEDLWPFVIAITSLQNRIRLTQNVEQCKQIIYMRVNDLVNVSGDYFGQGHSNYDCIIRYIGPVVELSPVGYFFGLELLNLDNGHSPQSDENVFSTKYMECDSDLSIFTTADWIFPITGEVKSKLSAREIINDTLQRARSAINNCTNGPNKSSSLRRAGSIKKNNKKSQTKQPSAQFYDGPLPITCDNFHEKNCLQEAECKTSNAKEGDTMENTTLQTLNSNQKAKLRPQKDTNTETVMREVTAVQVPTENTNASQSSSVQLITFESEDLNKPTENYKKNSERQYTPGSVSINIPNTGILKHTRGTSKDNSVKPLTITSLEGRDIVVIDKADIKESTKNESNIIVVDKQRQQKEVDLVDLLGGNWPNNAGDAALVLNKAQEQTQYYGTGGSSSNSSISSHNNLKSDRNKSPNLLSHIGTKGIQKDTNWVKSETATQTTANNPIRNATNTPLINANSISMGVSTTALEELESVSLSDMLPAGLGVGSMVEVLIGEKNVYGVIRWIGVPPDSQSVMVGVELEDEQDYKQLQTNNGSYNGVSLFKCQEGRALFIRPNQCSRDKRFEDVDTHNTSKFNSKQQTDTKMFGQVECPSVPGAVAPLKIFNLEELEEICGKFKGIQGHHNSCYLDATLFSMFTFTHVFDSLLFRPSEPDDISHYDEVQKVLREEIVNPLRKNVFVRADRVMKLRQLLDKLSSVSGLTSEEKDPEEFLNSLLTQIMRVEPFLKLSSGQDAYYYQLFVEKDERLSFPSVQQLFEQSFHSSDIKLKEVPSCLIIQMPRFGKNFKMYPRILPSQVLDVTDIIEDSPRQCSVCGKHAEFECRDCFGILQGSVGLESTAFCENCLKTVHQHTKRSNHKSKEISVPHDFKIMAEHMVVPRLYMELFAVVCIETSHYVAFVKAGSGPDAPWCFFDSMADRKGEQNGYNIPEMITVPDLPLWLSEEGARNINETFSNDKLLPEHAKRLFCDAYMCMYQSTDVMMYR